MAEPILSTFPAAIRTRDEALDRRPTGTSADRITQLDHV
jgi:hypothetical protein